jgi:DsbC/DsbD-like thiol-disulfide interchange protein
MSVAPGYAQDEGRQETAHLVVTPEAVATQAAPGARVALRLGVAPKAKMHVYSPEQKDYIPVSLTIGKNPAVTVQPAVFPKAEKYFFRALEETQLVYSKPFQIVQNVTIAKSAKPGDTITVKGTLEYQACDESVCYRPQKVDVSWTLTIKRMKGDAPRAKSEG